MDKVSVYKGLNELDINISQRYKYVKNILYRYLNGRRGLLTPQCVPIS